MKRIIFIFLLLSSGIMTVCACSVRPEINGFDWHYGDFRKAKAVFVGKVTNVSIDDMPIPKLFRVDTLYKVKFEIVKSWKGQNSDITVISDNGESTCGSFKFEAGKKYLIYANAFEDKLIVWATVSSPSRPLDLKDFRVKKRLKQLNSYRFRKKATQLHS